ncbi:MAG: FAD-binding protein [Oscillospiraceae bacterium]|nr:FAD-binding protein [Oscillospiraceae bacterium]
MADKEITRRTFVKGLAAGVASIAALGVLEKVGSAPAAEQASGMVSGMENLSEGMQAELAQATSGLTFKPGTYSASARGIDSDVKVTMTFDETKITNVEIDVSGETPDIGGKIGDQMAQAILAKQSADVDVVATATVTSNAIRTAAADCISQASGQAVEISKSDDSAASDWLGEAPEIADADITETVDTGILIVGLGTAGWPALMTAAEADADVLVIEKNAEPTSVRGDMGAIDTKWQKQTAKKFPATAIDKMEAIEDIVRYGTGYVNFDLVRFWADNSAEAIEWIGGILEDSGKYTIWHEGAVGDTRYPERDKAYATGHSPEKKAKYKDDATVTTNAVFTDYLKSLKYDPEKVIRCDTALIRLVQNEKGKVVGAIAQDQNDQHYIKINTKKGVIMCAGGYLMNTPMMNALQPMTQKMKVQCRIGSRCDGSGIKAMLWAGAEMDPIHTSMMFNRCCVKPDETAGADTSGEWFWFGEQPFLKVNLKGERFCNESGPYEFMLHAMMMQPNHTYCDIFDANNKEYTKQFQEVGCCRLWDFDNGAPPNRYYDDCWKSNEELIEKGYIQKADTLQELAEKLHIPAEPFINTVQRYNVLCMQGKDEDYGKAKHRLTPVNQAPYYGVRTAAWHLTTLDGVRINTDMQVLREDGTVIEGLYAAGDCSGGFFANNYPNLFTGLACGRSMTFGRHAALVLSAI